jgi:small subunit ribosomal protein S3
MKRAVQTAMDMGADGIKIRCAGRLGGADIARAEHYRQGKVPLQTLRVPLDYGFSEARTVYGIIGVKCWINRRPESEGGPSADRRPERRPRGDRRPGGDRGPRPERGGDRGDRTPTPPPGPAVVVEAGSGATAQ